MNYYTIIFFIIFIFSININKVIASDYNADSILTQGKPKPNENKSFFDKVKDFVTSKKGLIIVISSGAIILFILLLLIFLIIKKIRKNKRKNHYVEANNQEFYKDPNNYESNINKNNSYNYNEIYMNDSKKNDNNHHFNIDIKLSEDELNEESIPNENIPIAHSKNSTPMNSIRASDYQFNSNYKNNDDMYSDYDDKRYPSNNRNRNNSPLSPNYNSKSPISPKYNSNNRNNDPMSPNYNYNSNSRNNTLNSNYNSNGRNYNYNSNNRNNNFKNGSDESSKGNMNMKYNNNNHTSYETEEDNDISSISYDYNVSPYEKLIQNKPEHINVFDRESNPNRTSSLLSEDDINRLNGYLNKENNSNGGDNDSFIPSYYNDENLNNEDSENNVPIEFRNLQTYRVIHNFVPHRSDELEIEKGHLLKIIKSFEDGWALCYNINTKVKGFIPKNKLRIEDEPKPKMNVKAESMERNKMTNNIDKDSNNLNDNKNENNSENEDIQNVGKDDIKVVPNFQQGQIVLKFSDENKKKVEHQIVIEDGMLSRDNSCHVVYDYTDTSISFMNTPNLSNVKTASYQKDESFNQEHSNDNLLKPGRNYVPVKSKLRSVESTDDDDECYPRSSILSQQSVQQLSLSRQFLSSSQVPSSSTQRKRSSSQPAKPRDEGLYSHRPRPRSRSQGRYELSRYNEYRRSNRISDNLERNSVLSIDTNVYRNRYRRPNQEREVNEFYEDDFTFMIDSWGNSPNCFFGILYAQPAEGTGCQLEITHNFNHEKVKTMIKKFKELFPNHDALCHDYILSCVD